MYNLNNYEKAAEYIQQADGLLITGGAGMGVDSGLPDFRGNQGFWKAYPALANEGKSFIDMADPSGFYNHPERSWGFYGHRLNLYRNTTPHQGFQWLKEMGEQRPKGYFVFTSNVDGHYHKSGFDPDRIIECHGSINHLQCADNCTNKIWGADTTQITVNEERLLAQAPLPICPNCDGIARPNILMFGDSEWNGNRTYAQQGRFEQWLVDVENLAIIECGAGTAVPTVRMQGDYQEGNLIRINPREAETSKPNSVSIQASALEAIGKIRQQFL